EVSCVIIAVTKDYSEEGVANETTITATASGNTKIAQSSTVARYLSVYVLKRKRFTIELLPTPAPPNTTSRIRSKSAMFSLKQREQ
uniref:Uncharacterized protein n=1 Tax=Glossina palpalis gambiensis TaxID=67801 RepID=A0A1B0B3I9_9MUSC